MIVKRPNSPKHPQKDKGIRATSPRGYVDPDAMCDNTQISGTTWGELKEKAMAENYLKTSPFARYLSKNEKETLKMLIEK